VSRFHPNATELAADGAMIEYRAREAKGQLYGLDPAEWIEALHREHWQVLEQLRSAKEETEGERLAAELDKGQRAYVREMAA
jgi:hypothetical protein